MAKKIKIFTQEENKPEKLPPPANPKLTFDGWYAINQRKHNFKPIMREILLKHFKSRGFLENGDFDAGLKDYGID